jgi:protein deglycase
MQGQKPVVTVGLSNVPITGEAGLTCMPDTIIDEVNLEEIDSLLLPGCMDIIMNEDKLINFIKKVATNECIIASISSSPILLAKAGVLKGKKYTVGLTKECMIQSEVFEMANFSEELVVRDGNIITARGRGFIRFGKYLGEALNLTFDENWYKERT